MRLVPPHEADGQGQCQRNRRGRNPPHPLDLSLNGLIKLFPPRLQKTALPASLAEQPAGTGTFQFEAEAPRNLHSRAADEASKSENRHRQPLALVHQV
ncbi:hypothetical [Parasynechococcus marenigrum WH 8102]|uniref:Uncharacterized protein n=1 Tax=Parasynechococcus marenigrum (strain WH8102) TaxID=84588 RepID=Q7U829_PARMW|nr:hypothetical [Parasynechococcus marenigrum WH 8102]